MIIKALSTLSLSMTPFVGFLAPQMLHAFAAIFILSQIQSFNEKKLVLRSSANLLTGIFFFILLIFLPHDFGRAWGTYVKLLCFALLIVIEQSYPKKNLEERSVKILLTTWLVTLGIILIDALLKQPLYKYFGRMPGKMYIQGGLFISLFIWPLIELLKSYRFNVKLIAGIFSITFATIWFMQSDTAPFAIVTAIILALLILALSKFQFIQKFLPLILASFAGLFTFTTPFMFFKFLDGENIQQFYRLFKDTSYLHRLHIWQEISAKIFEKPFFGHGLESYRDLPHQMILLPSKYYQGELIPAEKYGIHPHNLPLQIAYEHGFIGLALMSVLIGYVLYNLLKEKDAFIRFLKLGCFFTAMFIYFVSVGAYQSWWISAIVLSITLFASTNKAQSA